jgi:virulence-associated protein VagC
MSQTAKLFANGRSQAVRLPAAYRFDSTEVFIRKDAASGDVILSRRPADWDTILLATTIQYRTQSGFPLPRQSEIRQYRRY